jgi:hypothetical protein
MNDYYPFLLERVSRLEGSDESRRKTYESVREDLFAKLARPALRVPEAEIAGERRAFDAAIQRIEADLARDGGVKVGTSSPSIAQTSPDAARPQLMTRMQPESAPALPAGEDLPAGEAVPEVKAPTMAGTVELLASAELSARPQPGPDPDRTFRADDFRVLPRGARGFDLEVDRRAPARTLRRQLLRMLMAIVICGLVLAAIYFSADIKTLLGI